MSSSQDLSQYKALVFDCYGTLIDWEKGMFDKLQPLLTQSSCPDRSTFFKAFGQIETKTQDDTPTMLYPDVLKHSYKTVAEQLNLKYDESAATAFGNSVGDWPAFPDSAKALTRLHKLGLKLVILSNVHRDGFDGSRKKLEEDWKFDLVCVAQDIGSYKPQLRNFHYALEKIQKEFGIPADQVLSVANSKHHDVKPAHAVGLKAAWINRPSAIMGVKGLEDIIPEFEYKSMEEFAGAYEKALGQ